MLRIFTIIITGLLFFSCGNRPKDCCQTKTTADSAKTETKSVDASFVSAGAIEGEADLFFKQENGEKIVFYRNYTDQSEPPLSYQLVGEDGTSANKEWVGKKFRITYKVNPKGRISMENGDSVACNQILDIKKLD